jgi:hypothetical protein
MISLAFHTNSGLSFRIWWSNPFKFSHWWLQAIEDANRRGKQKRQTLGHGWHETLVDIHLLPSA